MSNFWGSLQVLWEDYPPRIPIIEFQGKDHRRMVVARDPSVLMEYVAARRQMVIDMLPQLPSMYNHAAGKLWQYCCSDFFKARKLWFDHRE